MRLQVPETATMANDLFSNSTRMRNTIAGSMDSGNVGCPAQEKLNWRPSNPYDFTASKVSSRLGRTKVLANIPSCIKLLLRLQIALPFRLTRQISQWQPAPACRQPHRRCRRRVADADAKLRRRSSRFAICKCKRLRPVADGIAG